LGHLSATQKDSSGFASVDLFENLVHYSKLSYRGQF